MIKLNPFSHLTKIKKYPFGHIQGSHLFQRFKDVFQVFAGDKIIKNNIWEGQLGIIDYIFPIAPLADVIGAIETNKESNISSQWAIPLLLIPLLFYYTIIALKNLSSLVLTIAVTPIICLVHIWATIEIKPKLENIRNLYVSELKNPNNQSTRPPEFPELLPERKLNNFPENEIVKPIFVMKNLPKENGIEYHYYDIYAIGEIHFGFFKPLPFISRASSDENYHDARILNKEVKVSKRNWKAIQTMLELNLFHAAETLSNTEELSYGQENRNNEELLFNILEEQGRTAPDF